MKNCPTVSLYFHIPFCIQYCYYCDFHKMLRKDYGKKDIQRYQDAMIQELKYFFLNNRSIKKVDTIYFGGGTPSLYPKEMIAELLQIVQQNVITDCNAEITMEVDPKTIRKKSLIQLKDAGINRISIGAQTFQNKLLKKLGRYHQKDDIFICYEDAVNAGFANISVDLLYGIPEQNSDDVNKDLILLKQFNLKHVSLYNLTLSRGTVFFKYRKKLKFPDEDLEVMFYHNIKDFLKKSGLKHYEISNFAKPGFESRHNLNCWNYLPYKGIGAGAHSFHQFKRKENYKGFFRYIESIEKCKHATLKSNNISLADQKVEYIMLALRKIKGINRYWYQQIFGSEILKDFPTFLNPDFKPFIYIGKRTIRLKSKAINISNEILSQII